MKKIVALSDSHKNLKAITSIAEIMDESDLVIHLGDHYDDMDLFSTMLQDKLVRVHGNCDYGINKEVVKEVEDRRFLITHGDLYSVKEGLEKLKNRAKDLGCDTVLYGHTHKSAIIESEGILFINPGNMTAYGGQKSYAYIVVNGKKITAVINENGIKKII